MKRVFVLISLLVGVTSQTFAVDWARLFGRKQPVVTQVAMPNVAVFEFSNSTNLLDLSRQLVDIAKNSSIDGVLLLVDNTGGAFASFSTLHDVITLVKKRKPVVALVTGSALSCGYLCASAADYIIAHEGNDIGHIGILIQVERFKNTKFKVGNITGDIEMKVIRAGEFKTVLNPYEDDLKDQDITYVQQVIDRTYQLFLKMVAENRSLDITKSTEWAEGKVFLAGQAVEHNLIDQIGTIFDAQTKLLELIKEANSQFESSNDIILV